MRAKLLYRDAAGKDAAVDIAPEGVFLGRATDCVVRTDDAMVSRKNCKIAQSGGKWMVEDLGSSNGTFVNEVRVQKQALVHADVIRCGTLQVRFVEVGDEPQTSKPKTMSIETGGDTNIQVDPSLSLVNGGTGIGLDAANLMALKEAELQQTALERDALAARLREAAQELETAHARAETQAAELSSLRAEAVNLRDRAAEVGREKSLLQDELHAVTRVANELREELQALRQEHLRSSQRADELGEEMAARNRQLDRAHEDVQRTKQVTDELRAKLAELQKTKDEGWKELNTRVAELDQLREVMKEQERILEERRVGLMTLEATLKEVRADKERALREGLPTGEAPTGQQKELAEARARIRALEAELQLTREAAENAPAALLAEAQHPMAVANTSEFAIPPEVRIAQLEEELVKMGAELALAGRGDAQQGGDAAEIKRRAEDAYTGINDALSELRTHILLARKMVAENGAAPPELGEVIQSSIDRVEDAKGLLRALREVVET